MIANRHVDRVIASKCTKLKTLKQAISALFMDGAYLTVIWFKAWANQNSHSTANIGQVFHDESNGEYAVC